MQDDVAMDKAHLIESSAVYKSLQTENERLRNELRIWREAFARTDAAYQKLCFEKATSESERI